MPTDDRDTVEQALATFVDAFNHLDRARMEACFLDDATVFHPMGSGGYRAIGFWIDLFDQWSTERPGPPDQNLQPCDLQIQQLGDAAAVATFHLEHHLSTVGRRTIVLVQTSAGWKIAHLHASTFPRER